MPITISKKVLKNPSVKFDDKVANVDQFRMTRARIRFLSLTSMVCPRLQILLLFLNFLINTRTCDREEQSKLYHCKNSKIASFYTFLLYTRRNSKKQKKPVLLGNL